jgi:hypothetical protein
VLGLAGWASDARLESAVMAIDEATGCCRRAEWFSGSLIERAELATQNSNFRRGFEPKRHTVARHTADNHGDAIADDDFLTNFATEN